jgi:REP element-mobilizing transposase RayT
MRSTQTNFFDKDTKKRYSRTQHGGMKSKGRRKLERPLSTKNWIHLVLKSDKAIGKLSFPHAPNKIAVQKILKDKARKFGVSIADQANVGNHIHLKIRITSRTSFQRFLKAVTTLIARKITGARRGKKFGRFWQGLAYTRVLKSYIEELNLKGYFHANRNEAEYGPAARERMLKAFNKWIYQERGWSGV